MKPTLYLETSVPSYLVSRPSRDLIIAGHQQITRDWWERRRTAFDIFVSQFVLDEAKRGNPEQSGARITILDPIPLLAITPEVTQLAERLLHDGIVPDSAKTDAAHIAIASVHAMDYLMTWNCAHIANARVHRKIAEICRSSGYLSPVICTPEELLEE